VDRAPDWALDEMLGGVLAEGEVLACAGAPVEMAAPQVQQAASNPSGNQSRMVRFELRSVIAGTS
jgi:hypothetical protein